MMNWWSGVTESWLQPAQQATLADKLQAQAFGITPDKMEEMIQQRSHLLQSILPEFNQFCQTTLQQQPQSMLQVLWDVWLPLAMKIASSRQKLGHPLIQGILGGQGTGKTTMCKVLSLILSHLGYRSESLSLDDLYKTYSDRQELTQRDRRLIWRGPPGTHDIDLGLDVLRRVRQGESSVSIPRFDKSAYAGAGDRTTPEVVADVDILLFEGWFVGARPINPDIFDDAPPPIVTDADRQFARDMNHQLRDYLPLWAQLDSLIVLYPSDYRCSLVWRQQAEKQMLAAGKGGMSDSEIEEFVNYFWRSLHPELFIKPLIKDATLVDLVIEIHPDHSFAQVYRPA
jgi:D-glycerate 3-kinase